MKLHLSPQVKILIGNHRYSKKGEILLCETWSQTLPISVQCPSMQRKLCNPVQARFDKVTAYAPTLVLLPLLLGFSSAILGSQQRRANLHCMKTWPLRHNGEANKGQCCPVTSVSQRELQLYPTPKGQPRQRGGCAASSQGDAMVVVVPVRRWSCL